MAMELKQTPSTVMARRKRLAERGIILETKPLDGQTNNHTRRYSSPSAVNPSRLEIEVRDGPVVVYSDAHYWPGELTPSHKALIATIKRLKPALVIANGDMLDGATISRFDREGWHQTPTLSQELTACIDRMGEVEDAAGVDCELIWNLGNHDQRYERYIAINAAAMEGVPGTTLPEHFPRWTFAISTMINPKAHHPVMVKHRNAGGVHAGYNNTLKSGVSIVTGHLHRLLVTPWADYRGCRWGVDTGTLADPNGAQFAYAEDNPRPWSQGFAVLTFRDGVLLHPELCQVIDGQAFFRGELVQ